MSSTAIAAEAMLRGGGGASNGARERWPSSSSLLGTKQDLLVVVAFAETFFKICAAPLQEGRAGLVYQVKRDRADCGAALR
mmetsp:Transcript_6341/g.9860  ORF Transcript_6341/g.9860 Transcript_6341/m.9860 type:complete len:81 (-) Transcript_6341:243-485(-)